MLCIVFFIILLFILINKYNKKLNIKFYSKSELSYILYNDSDNYYANLNTHNLNIRNINDKDKYLCNIYKHLYTCNKQEENIIINAIKKSDNLLKKIKYPGFNYNKIKNIPWIIGCSKTNNYEFGYPHTRNNIIILNYENIYDKYLYKTLIHERIHIYQKIFPNDIKLFLNYFNFKKLKKKTNLDRANPDTDDFLYEKNGIIFECKIDNNNIKCTNNDTKYEHPFEYMAYEIVDLCG
jgi:hypothetical protein